MACRKYLAKVGCESLEQVRAKASAESVECILKYHGNCNAFCADPRQAPQACFACLKDNNSCASSTNPGEGCCPDAELALACLNCLDAGKECGCFSSSITSSLSTTWIIVISVVSGLVFIALVTWFIYYFYFSSSKGSLSGETAITNMVTKPSEEQIPSDEN